MLTLTRGLIRIFALLLSFAFSTLAAAVFVTFSLFLGGDASWLEDDLGVMVGSTAFLTVTWFTISQITFIPAMVILVLTEFTRSASLTLNVLAGGLCALIVLVLYPMATGLEGEIPYGDREIWLTGLAAGFVGGFTHWILAGRNAGRWMGMAGEKAPFAVNDPR